MLPKPQSGPKYGTTDGTLDTLEPFEEVEGLESRGRDTLSVALWVYVLSGITRTVFPSEVVHTNNNDYTVLINQRTLVSRVLSLVNESCLIYKE